VDALQQRLEVQPRLPAMTISPSTTQRSGSCALTASTTSGK
jgi:hypothetical protein